MIAFVSAAWRRFDVTRLALAQRADLCEKLKERGIEATQIIVADDQNLDIALDFGFWPIRQSNLHLGRKFNDGLQFALQDLGADHVVLIGSDDWMHEDLFDRLPLPVAPPPVPTDDEPVFWDGDAPEAITGTEIAIVDLGLGKLSTCRARGRFGVIPWIFPKEAFKTNRPINERLNKGIDGSLVVGLGVQPEWRFVDPHPYCRVDWKSAVNLNSYDKLRAGIGYGAENMWPWPALAEHYPAHLVEQAQTLQYEYAMKEFV